MDIKNNNLRYERMRSTERVYLLVASITRVCRTQGITLGWHSKANQ